MTFYDWLATQQGMDAFHAVELLVLALGAILNALVYRITHGNKQLLQQHIAQVDKAQNTNAPQ